MADLKMVGSENMEILVYIIIGAIIGYVTMRLNEK